MGTQSFPAKENTNEKYIFILFLILCYFSFFLRLTSYPILMWDESRFAVNAFELLKSKNFIVTTFNGVPDLWNTKPPLNVWIIAASMKLFGYSELAIRLPSALAALFTSIAVYCFVRKQLNDPIAGFFSGAVLISSVGYISVHIARSGDADSIAVLLMTLFVMKFYDSLSHPGKELIHKKSFYSSLLFFSLALLAKSAYPLFLLPGLFVFVFTIKKQKIFLLPGFFVACLASLIPFVLYCLLREFQNPGYLQAVWLNDFGGRFSTTIESHSGSVVQYFFGLLNNRFFYWFYIVLFSIPFLLKEKTRKETGIVSLSTLSGFSVLLIISLSETKLSHYDAAVFPFFSIIAGIALRKLFVYILSLIKLKKQVSINIYYCIFFLALFFYPYRKVLSYINIKPIEAAAFNLKYGPFMKTIYKGDENDSVLFYDNGYNAHLIFYTNVFAVSGKHAKMISTLNGLKDGDLVATCMPEIKKEITSAYQSTIYKSDEFCSCYRILKNDSIR
ncbi:hypothetical protein BH11BAC1_BH11BAC1_10080 [soil metagenome]